jgi:hypothetical protein
MWRCKCDCGKETLAISQCTACGRLPRVFAVKITYPVPENLIQKS